MLYTPSRVFVARPARSAARLVGHAAAAQTRRVQPASLLQAHLQVRRSTRCLGQLYKSGFTELCDVIMRTNETPLAAATHKLNQLKDKAVAYQTRQQMLQVGRARVLGGAAATSHEGAAATSHGGARLPAKAGAANA